MDFIAVEKQGPIVTIRFQREKSYNAFDIDTIKALTQALQDIHKEQTVKGLIITGSGKAFCTGGDLRWIYQHKGGFEKAFHSLATYFHLSILEIRRMPKPVIAAINGLAAGGGFSLALACDFRIMEKGAILKQGYTTNGLSVDGGLSFLLPRFVGAQKAMEILALDPNIDGEQALKWGLVNEVVEEKACIGRAKELMEGLLRTSLTSFAASKRLLYESLASNFEATLEREREFLAQCGSSANGIEGITAFLEKRRPIYNRD